jgi:putative flippase GtrA
MKRRSGLRKVLSFGLVGVVGFAIDAGVVTLLIGAVGPFGARLVSFPLAVLTTFLLNSRLTFAHRGTTPAQTGTFLRYFGSMLAGGGINWAVYGTLMGMAADRGLTPAFAVALGSLAGMAANLFLADRFVFRAVRRT